jgi:hypothetical protein
LVRCLIGAGDFVADGLVHRIEVRVVLAVEMSTRALINLSHQASNSARLSMNFIRKEANYHADVSRPFWTFLLHWAAFHDDNRSATGPFQKKYEIVHLLRFGSLVTEGYVGGIVRRHQGADG